MRKYSKQREVIRKYLCGRTDHPSAEQIYQAVRKDAPTISRGTVYRNLGLLSDDGEIMHIGCGDGSEHYDPRTEKHGHFYCRVCGRLTDIECPGMPGMWQKIENDSGVTINAANVVFNGICTECKKAR